ncbi:SURF1 family cytochrome oxidase biogenesis protein [Micrococcus lylae]|uniref:SURF1 family cytochrome oxidase biogenesis protein n=1 Tax=Micrococcus lylae TaxID=1273 RepID=UPI0021A6C7FD|nr:SURF1 family protein [Micrococcus lylae]MCT2007264.1 SURF1 family protein [Micrococcus lylae]MCT2070936.1 SURF1 family protein [Micrococcus lylae]
MTAPGTGAAHRQSPDAPQYGAQQRTKLDFRFLRTAPWIFGFVVCILFAFACHHLAQWQIDRRIQVMNQINRVLENYDDAPVPFADAPVDDFQDDDEWTPVTLSGEYLVEDTLVVRNRPRAGRPGYEVLVPFKTEEGAVVVVDRGWLPIGNSPGRPDSIPAPAEGQQEIEVRLRPGEPTLDRDAPEGQVASIDLRQIGRVTGLEVADRAYGEMVSESNDPGERPRPLVQPTLDEGPHLSYALQWYLFALMGFGVWGYMAYTRARNDRDDLEDAAEAGDDAVIPAKHHPRRQRVKRRRSGRITDEEAEDALFD